MYVCMYSNSLKSGLFDEIKRDFFQAVAHVSTTIWMHHMDPNKTRWEKVGWELHNNAVLNKSLN